MAQGLTPLSSASAWDAQKARHLLNRAGFGVPNSAIQTMTTAGAAGAVDMLVNYEKYADNMQEPGFLTSREDARAEVARINALEEDDRRKARNVLQREQRNQMDQLKTWWLTQMRTTSRPLQEKIALFWHGHFATSAEKVKLPLANYELNDVFRANATGNFRDLTFHVGKSQAMLNYLDNEKNRKGHPNENWARELMELFTLGIGNYTEQDIKESARSFTGYSEREGEFRFDSRNHDYGEKTFLGRTGNFDGADAIHIIFEQPECARHISRKLWEYFVYENPDDALVEKLAVLLRENDYELKPLLGNIFLSEEFYSKRAMDGQIKSPAQYMVMLTDQLQMNPERGTLVNLGMRAMGQELFYPPNVKGWDGNRAWINTNTLLTRYNIPGYLLTGKLPGIGRDQRLDEMGMEGGKARELAARNPARAMEYMQKRAGLDVSALWKIADGKTHSQAIDMVADHLLGRPLQPEQRLALLASMGRGAAADARFNAEKTGVQDLSATLHLILSMAEYQLC